MLGGTYTLRPTEIPRQFHIDYASLLNQAQYEAVTALTGAVLVIAGAGTGKTRTLVFRVARLVESGIDPQSLLLLTFTRKASQEMLRRASTLLDGRCERVSGGTFHSFANLTLRRFGSPLGLSSGFTILDRGDGEDVINLLRAGLGLDKKERRFPRKQAIAELFSAAVNKSLSLGDLLDGEYAHLADHTDDLRQLQTEYASYKGARQLLDYDDLLVKLYQLLAEHEEARRTLSQRYRFIMVDEYQDTNALQAEIVRLLATEHGNVMAVGDDAQSIYAFRGANFRNIMDFPKLFPSARVIPLEHNYRSTQPILDLTNTIISQATERYTKNLFTTTEGGEAPYLIAAHTENFQSRFVCQRVLELREEGVPLEDIAVLFRSSFHSFDLELELTRCDIPFVKRGGFKFVETAHVKDTLAHLRVFANPRDGVSWHRILLLIQGVGPRAAEDILQRISTVDDMPAALEGIRERSYSGELHALAGLLRRIRQGEQRPSAQLGEVLRYYEHILKRIYRDDYPKRQKDLEHFVAIANRYESLEPLLADMALEPPSDSVNDIMAVEEEEGLLTLSTVHSAKGLEWHTVFIIWAVDGKFPSVYSIRDASDMDEERRLMYVAATRAKTNLYISYPINMYDRAAGMVLSKPTRFVDNIPRTVLRPVQLVEGE